MIALKILTNKYGEKIATTIIEAYKEIEENFILEKWKASELDSGHFVEAVRRLIEQELFGIHTPFDKNIPAFNDNVLLKYQNVQNKDASYRMLIPRVLKAIYGIRNKRGVAHISSISPNRMDSTYIFYSVKWVLAELIRLNSNLMPDETQKIIDQIVERKISVLWKTDDFIRLMPTNIPAKDQVLILLYDNSPISDKDLQNIIEYQNSSKFKTLLKSLHSSRKIEYRNNGLCLISPKGQKQAEELLLKFENR